MECVKNRGLFFLISVSLLVPWGCASNPQAIPTLSSEVRSQLGTIGVVSAQYTPSVEFEVPAKGWLGGAGRGAVSGSKVFIVLVPSAAIIAGVSVGIMVIPPAAGYGVAGALYAVAALLKGAGYMIVGPFYGAAVAEAPETVEEAEDHLKNGLAAMRIQETMRGFVTQAARPETHQDMQEIEGQGPKSPSDLLTYLPLQGRHFENVLEVRVTRVWLSTTDESIFKPLASLMPQPSQELKINPPLSLGMELRVRLIRNVDKVVLYDNTLIEEGEAHLFTEWAADDARLFSQELERAYGVLAQKVAEALF